MKTQAGVATRCVAFDKIFRIILRKKRQFYYTFRKYL